MKGIFCLFLVPIGRHCNPMIVEKYYKNNINNLVELNLVFVIINHVVISKTLTNNMN
jgi:hypothetical protein